MVEGFVVASTDMIPFNWFPRCKFASADLSDVWNHL